MSEVRDVEERAAKDDRSPEECFGDIAYWLIGNTSPDDILSLDGGFLAIILADWRAKKAALSEAILQLEYLHERWPTGTGEAVLMRLRQDPPPPPQSTAYPDDSQDGQA